MDIVVMDAPVVVASNDTIITMGDSLLIGAYGIPGGGIYTWTPSSSMNPLDGIGDTVMVGPVLSTYYVIQYDDGSYCYGYDTIYVEVIPVEYIDVPNAFSPNGDGIHDYLFVCGPGYNCDVAYAGEFIKSIRFKIYNRYGQMVFSTESTSEGWDGTFNGKQLDPGVFAWVLEYTFVSNKTGVKSGNVTLLR
jgi:gliding motility-associated-like protein